MVDSAAVLTQDDVVGMYEKFGIATRAELESRREIAYENYAKRTSIEANVMVHMASKAYIPAVVAYTGDIAASIAALEEVGASTRAQRKLLGKVNPLLEKAQDALDELEEIIPDIDSFDSLEAVARTFHDDVLPVMQRLREPIDELELLVDQDMWPMYSYGDMPFDH